MPRYRTTYPLEFRRQMVDLVRSGRTPEELAREFEPTAQSISTWVKQAERESRRASALMGRQALSGRNWGAFDVRTIACVRSATSWQRRQPGSPRSRANMRTSCSNLCCSMVLGLIGLPPGHENAPALLESGNRDRRRSRALTRAALLRDERDYRMPSSSRNGIMA